MSVLLDGGGEVGGTLDVIESVTMSDIDADVIIH